jgi:predicted nucleic acid-binding protein
MTFMTQKIFIDASFLVAFIDRTNIDHIKAGQIMENLARDNFQVFTSSLVINQTFIRLEKEIGSVVADEFLQAILESNIQTLYPEQSDLLAGFRVLKTLTTRNASINEILNSVLMYKYRVYTILTFDTWHNLQKTQVSNLLS